MEWLSLLLTAVLFAAACNLDTVILSMGYAVKGVRVSLSHSLIIAALTHYHGAGNPQPVVQLQQPQDKESGDNYQNRAEISTESQ